MFGDPFAGIDDLNLAGLSFYLNPSDNQWTILSENTNINEVQLINPQGEILFETFVDGSSLEIDASAFVSGVYIARVSTDKGMSITRMVKK